MAVFPRLAVLTLFVVVISSFVPAEGFFFNSQRAKSVAQRQQWLFDVIGDGTPVAQWYSIRDYNHPAQNAYSYDNIGGLTVAVPVAVPIAQQKLAPVASTYQGSAPVQLVPCLCPISRDPELVKSSPVAVNSVATATDPNNKQR